MSDTIARLNAALEGRYYLERGVGEGGMATVYLAQDVRHGRKVALKVLRPELAAVVGADRFLTEIRTTAGFQHPHVLPLFDSGQADGFLFYVMPYVEGESLRARLDREGQLPAEEAVELTRKIADALDYAHAKGIIHRDVKPGNVLLSERGEPLVADFGIALAVAQAGGHRLTETGLSVGTPHYMSPEQAAGDERLGPASDVYSLGCTLYEMLTGEPPHTGANAQAVLARILTESARAARELRPTVPMHVDGAIRQALERVPADRFVTASDFASALADPAFRYGSDAQSAATSATSVAPWRARAIAATAVAVLVTGLWVSQREPTASPQSVATRVWLTFAEGQDPYEPLVMRFTPDATSLVYVGRGASPGTRRLWIRPRGSLTATPIAGTEGATTLAPSSDGAEIAFIDGQGVLRTVSLGGGPSRPVAEDALAVWAWTPDGILYSGASTPEILRVPVAGGAPEPVTALTGDECDHFGLTTLPGGSVAVFTVGRCVGNEYAPEVWSLDLRTGERHFVAPGGLPQYAVSGHLVYVSQPSQRPVQDQATVLVSVPFDPEARVASGEPRVVAEAPDMMDYALSSDGALIFPRGDVSAELVWIDRSGQVAPVEDGWRFTPPGVGHGWSVSPDGSRIALTDGGANDYEIWVKSLPAGPLERLTFGGLLPRHPIWSPDGAAVTYFRVEGGRYVPTRVRSDGAGDPERLLDDPRSILQGTLSADGAWMVLRTFGAEPAEGRRDIVAFRPGVDSVAAPLVATDFMEQAPALSPDGRRLAYTSDETGREEVYVRPFPDVGSGRVRVSIEGGMRPRWSRRGDELYFVDGGRTLVAARFDTAGDELGVQRRERLFSLGPEYILTGPNNSYDVAPDGRFLFARRASGELARHVLIIDALGGGGGR